MIGFDVLLIRLTRGPNAIIHDLVVKYTWSRAITRASSAGKFLRLVNIKVEYNIRNIAHSLNVIDTWIKRARSEDHLRCVRIICRFSFTFDPIFITSFSVTRSHSYCIRATEVIETHNMECTHFICVLINCKAVFRQFSHFSLRQL